MTDTATAAQRGFTQDGFDAFMNARREPQWLLDLRQQSWETFQRLELPSRREEEWMRTDIRLFHFDHFQFPTASDRAVDVESVLSEGVDLGGSVLSANGQGTLAQLDQRWADRGVLFGDLSTLATEHESVVRPWLQQIVAPGTDKFAALHAACWTTGSLLYVPRNVVVDQPLFAQSALSDHGVDLGHTLVILDEGAEATLLNEMLSTSSDDGGLHCGATEIILEPRSRLRFVNLQNWGFKTWHFAHQKARVGRDASLQWTVGALGSRLAKVNQQVALTGAGAECQVNGVMFTEGKQHLSYHTLQHHVAPHCRSDFLYKAALQDQSRTVWRGMIKVDPQAQKTDGYQRNDNLLLSSNARADAIPGLEIEADDVRCTHGATTGRVDDELIFYAQSRGLTRREAVRLVVAGFFQQVFDRISIESVRDALALAIAKRVREIE